MELAVAAATLILLLQVDLIQHISLSPVWRRFNGVVVLTIVFMCCSSWLRNAREKSGFVWFVFGTGAAQQQSHCSCWLLTQLPQPSGRDKNSLPLSRSAAECAVSPNQDTWPHGVFFFYLLFYLFLNESEMQQMCNQKPFNILECRKLNWGEFVLRSRGSGGANALTPVYIIASGFIIGTQMRAAIEGRS